MSELRKKLKNSDNELVAFKIDDGIAVGTKKQTGLYCDAVVILKEKKDGTVNIIINQDKLHALGGKIIKKNFDDPMPE